MKTLRQNNPAFTLVELLTVIAIIAILMGLLFPVIGSVKDKARALEATNVLKQFVSALQSYSSDYGKYPVKSGAAGADFSAGDDPNAVSVIKVLRALPTTPDEKDLNPRLVSYIDLPAAKTPDPTKAYSGLDSAGNMRDPWGSVYRFKMDSNYDNQLDNPYKATTGAGEQPLIKGAIAWCLGKDTKGATAPDGKDQPKNVAPYLDDIISW